MKEKLIEILSKFGYPVFLQGSLNPNTPYPDSFFTFWVFQADETTHYSNNPVSCEWGFWVQFYSNDPEKVETVPLLAKADLRANGFILVGKPVDVKSDFDFYPRSP